MWCSGLPAMTRLTPHPSRRPCAVAPLHAISCAATARYPIVPASAATCTRAGGESALAFKARGVPSLAQMPEAGVWERGGKGVGTRLIPQWQSRLERWAAEQVVPLMANGTVVGAFIGGSNRRVCICSLSLLPCLRGFCRRRQLNPPSPPALILCLRTATSHGIRRRAVLPQHHVLGDSAGPTQRCAPAAARTRRHPVRERLLELDHRERGPGRPAAQRDDRARQDRPGAELCLGRHLRRIR